MIESNVDAIHLVDTSASTTVIDRVIESNAVHGVWMDDSLSLALTTDMIVSNKVKNTYSGS